jgi:hypothetical protein
MITKKIAVVSVSSRSQLDRKNSNNNNSTNLLIHSALSLLSLLCAYWFFISQHKQLPDASRALTGGRELAHRRSTQGNFFSLSFWLFNCDRCVYSCMDATRNCCCRLNHSKLNSDKQSRTNERTNAKAKHCKSFIIGGFFSTCDGLISYSFFLFWFFIPPPLVGTILCVAYSCF